MKLIPGRHPTGYRVDKGYTHTVFAPFPRFNPSQNKKSHSQKRVPANFSLRKVGALANHGPNGHKLAGTGLSLSHFCCIKYSISGGVRNRIGKCPLPLVTLYNTKN
jgi:hypothetical protein